MLSHAESASLRVMLPWRERLAAFAARNLSGTRGLVVSGAGMTVIYLLMTLAFPITSWWYRVEDNLGTIPSHVRWARPLIALGGPHQLSVWMALITLGIIVALFGLQALATFAARTSQDSQKAQRLIISFAVAFIAVQVMMQPITSTDLYGYLARSYLIATLHQNPTISLSTFLPGGYLVPHARPPAPYGPLWLLICGGVGAIAGENLLLAMLLMKAIVAAATIGTILLVARLADRILPGQRVQALVFFAWSPLLIFEAAGNGHNDMVMMVCVVGALAAIQAKKPFWAFPLLALGVLIKYSVGALVPLWAVFLLFVFCWRTDVAGELNLAWPPTRAMADAVAARIRWRRVLVIFGAGGALSMVLAAIFYAPFWVGLKTFTGLGQQLGATYFNGSIAGMVDAALQFAVSSGPKAASLASAIRLMLYLVYGAYVILQTWHLARRGSHAQVTHLALGAGKIIFATLVLVTFWYQPWYITWLLPLAALAPDAVLRRHAATLALGGMLTYIVQYFAFVNQPDLMRDFFVQFFLVIVAFAPLLLLQHSNESGGWRLALNRYFSGLSTFVAERPTFVSRLMLALILIVAALLRLIKLGSASTNALHQISGNLSVAVSDARGLNVLFVLLQALFIKIFGPTPFAVLLPTALIGTATVWLIASLTDALFAETLGDRSQIVSLLAALFAATAPWHVALSRTGAEVTLLPLLISAAALAQWRARRLRLAMHSASEPVAPPETRSAAPQSRLHALIRRLVHPRDLAERRLRLLALMGLCIGLMGDLEPGLWPMPLLLLLVTLGMWWRRRAEGHAALLDAAAQGGGIILAALPAFWYPLSRVWGFPPSSPFLARDAVRQPALAPFTMSFWQHVPQNLWNVAQVLVTQNYNAAGPVAGDIPILPALLLPFVIIGAGIALRRWRNAESVMLGVLALLPFGVALAVAEPVSVIEAATVLPIACILPALGLEEVAHWLATVSLVVTGPVNTVFISRRNMVTVALLLILLIATVSTFFWYFASTIVGPTHIVRPA